MRCPPLTACLTTSCSRAILLASISCLLISTSSGCFIRNCPIGGKRSSQMNPIIPQRECMSCGPNGIGGQCVGPNICCGYSIGCFIGTAEAKVCGHENDSPLPCQIDGSPCGQQKEGRCVANSICCTDESCSLDSSCQSNSKRHENLSQDLLRYMHQLMVAKGYERR